MEVGGGVCARELGKGDRDSRSTSSGLLGDCESSDWSSAGEEDRGGEANAADIGGFSRGAESRRVFAFDNSARTVVRLSPTPHGLLVRKPRIFSLQRRGHARSASNSSRV